MQLYSRWTLTEHLELQFLCAHLAPQAKVVQFHHSRWNSTPDTDPRSRPTAGNPRCLGTAFMFCLSVDVSVCPSVAPYRGSGDAFFMTSLYDFRNAMRIFM